MPHFRLGTIHTNGNKWGVTTKKELTAKSCTVGYVNGYANFLTAFPETFFESQNLWMRYSDCIYEVAEYGTL